MTPDDCTRHRSFLPLFFSLIVRSQVTCTSARNRDQRGSESALTLLLRQFRPSEMQSPSSGGLCSDLSFHAACCIGRVKIEPISMLPRCVSAGAIWLAIGVKTGRRD